MNARGLSGRVTAPAELSAALVALARRLAAERLPDEGGGPQWIGDEVDAAAGPAGIVLRTGLVDDGLLTGRAGIALALATAAHIGKDERLADLAVLTIQDVLSADEPRSGFGWQSGALGVAIAAERIARVLHRPDIGRRGAVVARRAVAAIAGGAETPPYADLLDGTAGHLMAVLAAPLPRSARADRDRAAARLLAVLRAEAEQDGIGARWPMAGTGRAVTGMAHGSSGIALALASARSAGIAGSSEDLVTAALAWEDAWYADEDAGWYDLRIDEPVIGMAWCHGAPGIGIAAAAATRLGDDAESTYLRATRSAATAAIETSDATLCHGLGGIVELHLAGAEAWPDTGREHLRAARTAAAAIVDGVSADGTASWTHGVPGGSSPAVLDGTAGVVLTLARCIDPALVAGAGHPGLPRA